jgi:hypothetical protein
MNRREWVIAIAAAVAAMGVSFAARGQTRPQSPRWEAFCLTADKAQVRQDWTNNDLDKPDGWNRVIQWQSWQGWEPFQVLTTAGGGRISAVCFKHPTPGP